MVFFQADRWASRRSGTRDREPEPEAVHRASLPPAEYRGEQTHEDHGQPRGQWQAERHQP